MTAGATAATMGVGGRNEEETMAADEITVQMSRADAEVLLGVLAAERHNPEAEAVCAALRQQLDAALSRPA